MHHALLRRCVGEHSSFKALFKTLRSTIVMRIVLALDGSTHSDAALRLLTRIPWPAETEVTVVSARSPSDSGSEDVSAKQLVDEVQQALPKSCILVSKVVDSKSPKELILQQAAEIKADLIVMGASGHGAAHRLVLGSVSDYVANHAKCSVLLARPLHEDSAGLRLLIACDGSEGSKVAYHQACSYPWEPQKTHAHLVMVLEKPKLIEEDQVYDQGQIDDGHRKLDDLRQLNAVCDDIKQTVKESVHVGQGICSIANQSDTDMLFIGSTSKSTLQRLLLGSTSAFVAHHAHCCIWIAKENEWD